MSNPTTYFQGASNFNIGSVVVNNDYYGRSAADTKYWRRLFERTAPLALFDSKASFSRQPCDEDTRVVLNQEVMDWIRDRVAPTRLLCMVGPAGSGKSAIQQTIATRCHKLKVLAATFFFSTTDNTRNTVDPVVPTLAYQLGLASPELRRAIIESIARDDAVFTKSLEAQIKALIVEPFLRCRRQQMPVDEMPYAILIDGVDECQTEADQAELLVAIGRTLLNPNTKLPFRIFMSGRPEPAIVATALRSTGALYPIITHMKLNGRPEVDSDIRKYLARRFRRLANESTDYRAKAPGWPGEGVLNLLVRSASKQFIVATAVIQYVSDRRSSGLVDRLHTVLECGTVGTESFCRQPFATLDQLYYRILAKARANYNAAEEHGRDFVLVLRCHYFLVNKYSWDVEKANSFLGLTNGKLDTLVFDLQSLVEVDSSCSLLYHHKSFLDFLNNRHRSKDLYRSEMQVEMLVRSLAFSQTLNFLTLGYISASCHCFNP